MGAVKPLLIRRALGVSSEKSVLPWMRPAAFQVLCPWRTCKTRVSRAAKRRPRSAAAHQHHFVRAPQRW